MEFQLEYDRPGTEGGFDRVHLHPRCFAAWESELQNRDGCARGAASGSGDALTEEVSDGMIVGRGHGPNPESA
jgi:hypothetical protein